MVHSKVYKISFTNKMTHLKFCIIVTIWSLFQESTGKCFNHWKAFVEF